MKFEVYELYKTVVDVDLEKINMKNTVKPMTQEDYARVEAFLIAADPNTRGLRSCVETACVPYGQESVTLAIDAES